MSLQPLDELFKILKDERVAELLKENERLQRELNKLSKRKYVSYIYTIGNSQFYQSAIIRENIVDGFKNWFNRRYEKILELIDMRLIDGHCHYGVKNIMNGIMYNGQMSYSEYSEYE